MKDAVKQSYSQAEVIARRRARNFYYSFLVLPGEKRRAICAVYAFMRQCDDIVDGGGYIDARRQRLTEWRTELDAALDGGNVPTDFMPAFRDAVRRFSIPREYFHWMIDGVGMDLTRHSYPTFEELYGYCFKVASSVGLTCLHIFGFSDEKAKKYAEHCGIAFQLTNILRDIREDSISGRVYLPQEDLLKFNYSSEDLRRGIVDDRFRRLMAFEVNRAQKYYDCGRKLLTLVDAAGRPALWAMIEIYGRLLRKITRSRFDVFGSQLRLSAPAKLSIAGRALLMRLRSAGWAHR